jgi:gas vesicle protein
MDNNNKSGNNFLGGFLFGVLVGAVIVFLLATKKGKKILKAISDDGLDNISDILEKVNKTTGLDEMYDEEEPAPQRRIIAVKEVVEERPKTRRFFKGISRHLN